MHLSHPRTDTRVQRETYTWENRAPVHLSRLWTDTPEPVWEGRRWRAVIIILFWVFKLFCSGVLP